MSYLPFLSGTVADLAQPTGDLADATDAADLVSAVFDQLAGWLVASPNDPLIDALIAAGATQVRFAHVYSRDLAADPPDPAWLTPQLAPGVRLARDGVDLIEQGRLLVRAYPSGHADHDGDDPEHAAAQLARIYGDEYLGPVLDGSTLAIDGDRLAAVLIINRTPGTAPSGGPWVSEVFRDPHPRYAGLGSALLRRGLAVLAAEGEASLSFVVSDTNPARVVYERIGFRHCESARKVRIPE